MNLKYIVHFSSIGNRDYDIEIYDPDYVGNAIELEGGDVPFVTDEAADTNVFLSIRSQVGTIRVINQYDDGSVTRFVINELQPVSNTSTPVLFVMYYNNAGVRTRKVMWQGYLSGETYEQVYNDIPQYLDLGVNSMLESLKSIEITQDDLIGRMKIRKILSIALGEIETAGVLELGDVYVSYKSEDILDKYIETYPLYEESTDTVSEKRYDYKIKNPTAYDVVKWITDFMGWCVREDGRDIYFQRIGDESKMVKFDFNDFALGRNAQIVNVQSIPLDNNKWMGTDHTITISRGAKKVTVNSNIKDADFDIVKLPEAELQRLYNWSEDYQIEVQEYYEWFPNVRRYSFYLDRHNNDEGIIKYLNWLFYNQPPIDIDTAISYFQNDYDPLSQVRSTFACLSVCRIEYRSHEGETESPFYQKGLLFVNGNIPSDLPVSEQFDHYLFSIKSQRKLKLINGMLNFKIEFNNVTYKNTSGNEVTFFSNKVYYTIRVGNKYLRLDDQGQGLSNNPVMNLWTEGMTAPNVQDGVMKIPIGIFDILELDGYLELRIFQGKIGGGEIDTHGFTFLKSVSIDYEVAKLDYFTSQNSHVYTKIINKNFDEDISIDTNISTIINDNRSPSFVLNTPALLPSGEDDFMEELSYQGSTTFTKRPEKELLERMENYYSKNRRIVKVIVDKEDRKLPLIQFTELEEGKTYIPISESKDWQTDISKITCMEIPEGVE